ncbi:hypothetical protein [Rheinheimera gaetbuli]
MGVTADFIIKHVRPADSDAFEMMCKEGSGLWVYLRDHLGLAEQDIRSIFTGWSILVDSGLNQHTLNGFVQMAQAVSQARWDELYTTAHSTILFLTGPLLKELSYSSGKHPGVTFDFQPHEMIPLAVTIHRNGAQPDIDPDIAGIQVATDANGNCVHFGGLIQ